MRFKVVLTCVVDQICLNVRLLSMRVENKPLYAFKACIFDENGHMCYRHTSPKQSGIRFLPSRQTPLKQGGLAATRFRG